MSTIILNARDCAIIHVDYNKAKEFYDKYHKMGSVSRVARASSYGLTFDGELVAVGTFGSPRTSAMRAKYTREIIRLCFKEDVVVRGGASKIIKNYIRLESPPSIFTYQDTSGKASDVYEKSGMKLVGKKNVKKKVLVRNGINFSSALNDRIDWFSMEQASTRGPDALIGTNLGEVFREDGTRKSNIDLFTEECEYHIEEIPGDRLYEWENPDVWFYIYRIESTVDDNYYIGRHTIRSKQKPSIEDCLNDGYLGSGGKKMQEWILSVPEESLLKKVIKIVPRWRDAVSLEKREISQKYKEDDNCMNSMPGGIGNSAWIGRSKRKILGDCEIHKLTNFSEKGKCLKCLYSNTVKVDFCFFHGRVKFQGESCLTCKNRKTVEFKKCEIHGITKHQGEKCNKCVALKMVKTGICNVHGEVKLVSGICRKCSVNNILTKGFCPIHGEQTFQGKTCCKCTALKAISNKECPIHGITKHQGEKCNKCISSKKITINHCEKHGEVKFNGSTCAVCLSRSLVSKKECPIHGLTKFQGEKCSSCSNSSLISLKSCEVHGESKHRGKSCMKCAAAKRKNKIRRV